MRSHAALTSILALADAPSQVTVTLPVPGLVFHPMFHVQETLPSGLAVLGASPWAVLVDPAGVTYLTVHDAPGLVSTSNWAWVPGVTGEVMDSILTAEAGWLAVGVGVGVAVGLVVGVGEGCAVGVAAAAVNGMLVGTAVGLGVGTGVEVGAGVAVGDGVGVTVGRGTRVGVGVSVAVGDGDGVGTRAAVGDGVGVA